MVYVYVPVSDLEASVRFYVDQLGLFDRLTEHRLKCKFDIGLFVELVLCGTDEHSLRFHQKRHCVASFRVHLTDKGFGINLLRKLREQSVYFEENADLGGHFLTFTDPSGNRFVVHANHGVIT